MSFWPKTGAYQAAPPNTEVILTKVIDHLLDIFDAADVCSPLDPARALLCCAYPVCFMWPSSAVCLIAFIMLGDGARAVVAQDPPPPPPPLSTTLQTPEPTPKGNRSFPRGPHALVQKLKCPMLVKCEWDYPSCVYSKCSE